MKKQTQTKNIRKSYSHSRAIAKPVAAVVAAEQKVSLDVLDTGSSLSIDDGSVEPQTPADEIIGAPIKDALVVSEQSNGDTQQAQSSTPISPRPLDVAVTVAHIEKLRDQADANDQQFTIPGRNVVRAMMSDVYAMYHEVMSSVSSPKIIELLKSRLYAQEVKFRSSSKDASVLIRYVFRELSDKQVHVYSVALEVAFLNQVLSPDFAKFIGSRGGFEKIRAEKAEPKAGKFGNHPIFRAR
jgi:hypothetical protein